MIRLCSIILITTLIITLLLLIFTNKSYFKDNEKVLIPLTFKNNMKNFMNNNFNDIKYFNDYKIINGISMPLDIKTDHTRDELNSKEHIENLTELFFLLNIFHNFSIKNNILYTISAGNILGYYSGCVILPWDDDIDVMVKNSDFDKINNIWNNGEPEYKIWDNNWTYKKIKLISIK